MSLPNYFRRLSRYLRSIPARGPGKWQRRRHWATLRLEILEERAVPSFINWVNYDQPSDNFDEVFGANASVARGDVLAAMQSWQNVITNFNQAGGGDQIDITLSMDPSQHATGRGGGTNVTSYDSTGHPTAASITIQNGDNGFGAGYFLDPTPGDYSEFQGNIVNAFAGYAQTGSPAANLTDFITIVTHELGHAMGEVPDSQSALQTSGYVHATGKQETNGPGFLYVFAGPDVKVLLTSDNDGTMDDPLPLHDAYSNTSVVYNGQTINGTEDLMNGGLGPSERRLIPDWMALMLHDAYGYSYVLPSTLGTMYASLNQATGNLLLRADDGGGGSNITMTTFMGDVKATTSLTTVPPTPPGFSQFASSFPTSVVKSITAVTGAWGTTVTLLETPNVPISLVSYGPDTLDVGEVSSSAENVLGNVTVTNPNGSLINIVVDDAPATDARTITVTDSGGTADGEIAGMIGSSQAPGTLTYVNAQVNDLTVLGSSGADIFNIQAAPQGNTYVDGDSASTTVNVGWNGNTHSIAGAVWVTDSTGRVTVTVDDSADSGTETATVETAPPNNAYGEIGGLFSGSGVFYYEYAQVAAATLLTGKGNEQVNIESTTKLGTGVNSLSIVGNSAHTTVTAGQNGSAQAILGSVTITNPTAYTAIIVDDSTDATTRIATLSSFTVTTGVQRIPYGQISGLTPAPAVIDYKFADTSSVTIKTGTASNSINVQSTGVPTTISSGGLHGTGVTVGDSNGVQDINGPLTVINTAAVDSLTLNDQTSTHGGTVTVTGTSVSGLAPTTITFGGAPLATLDVNAGVGGTEFNMASPPLATTVYLSAMGSGNTVAGPSSGATWLFSLLAGAPQYAFLPTNPNGLPTNFSGIQTINGGAGNNDFDYIGTGFPGTIIGGSRPGSDTIDVSQYGGSIFVNPTAAGTLHGEKGTVTASFGTTSFDNIDTTITAPAPTVSVAAPGSGSFTNNSQPTLTATADDAGGPGLNTVQFEYTYNGGNSTLVSANEVGQSDTYSYTFPTAQPDGTYTVNAVATDVFGVQSISLPITFTVDTVAPTITMTEPLTGSVTTGEPTLAATTAGGGLNYNASSGELPQSIGFQFVDSGGSPAPTVAGGILSQGSTSGPGAQYWTSTSQVGSFDNGFTMEADLKVISSTQSSSTRFGYYLDAGDSAGWEFSIGISSTGVAVNTDGTGSVTEGIPLTPFNTTNGFHDYKLVVSGGVGTLFIDNVAIGSTPVDSSPIVHDTPNQVFFGDATGNGDSQTELKSFNFSFHSVTDPSGVRVLFQTSGDGGMTWGNDGPLVTSAPYTYTLPIPLSPGSYEARAIAFDGAGNSTTSEPVSFTVSSTTSPLSITTSTLTNWDLNLPGYSQTIAVAGGVSPYHFALVAGSLPNGLALDVGSGTISGTPTATGAFSFDIEVTDSNGSVYADGYGVTIVPALAITTANLNSWNVNQPGYNQTVATTGGTGPLTFGIQSGSLPSGLWLNTSTGAISGTPDTQGTFDFTVEVSDAVGAAVSQPYAVTIGAVEFAITTTSLPNGTLYEQIYNQTIGITGGSGFQFRFAVTSGALPGGLTLYNTGQVFGVPYYEGTFDFTVTVTDAANDTASQNYTVTINKPPEITTTSLPNWTVNVPGYNQTINADGGTAPLGFSVVSGTNWGPADPLPTGRQVLAATTGTDGTIYAIGGIDVSNQLSGEVDAYDPATNVWTTLASLPNPRYSLAATTGADGTIYAIGGYASGGQSAEVDAYNPATNTWTIKASLPVGRFGLAAATGPDGTIYAIGGYASGGPTAEVDAYNPTTNTWTTTASLPDARFDLAATTGLDGTIYAISGIDASGYTGEVDTFTPQAGWTTIASIPTARATLAATTGLDGTIYAIGGVDGGGAYSDEVDAYNPATGLWTMSTSLLSPRTGLAAATAANGTIYVIGGSTPAGYSAGFAEVDVYISSNLPPGLTLDPNTGILSGTPTTAGAYSFTITATDATGTSTSQSYTVTINSPLTVTSTSLKDGIDGQAYSQPVAVSGGTVPLTYSLLSGSLPDGLSLNSGTGAISGTPDIVGTSTFTIAVTDGLGDYASQALSITIDNPPFAITTTTLANWTIYQPNYSQTIATANGIGPFSFAVTSAMFSFPTGLTLDSGSGLISGTPYVSGGYTFTITATDSTGAMSSQTYTITINHPLQITTTMMAGWMVNQPGYNQTVFTSGGTGSDSFAISVGSLPPGLNLAAASGMIGGTPTATGIFPFTVTVTDASGAAASENYSITVNPPIAVSVAVNGSTAPILNATVAGGTVTITTDGPSGFATGQIVLIAGVDGTGSASGFNGAFTISGTSGDAFSYADSNAAGASTGNGTATTTAAKGLLTNGADSAHSQRSMVDSLVYTFNQAVSLGSGAFAIKMLGQGGIVPTLAYASPDSGVTWVVTFGGSGVVGNSIANGEYQILLNASLVTAVAGGSPLASNDTESFYRLFGDTGGNGHQRVNTSDTNAFLGTFNLRSTAAAFLAYLDANDDGRVNTSDTNAYLGDFNIRYTAFTASI